MDEAKKMIPWDKIVQDKLTPDDLCTLIRNVRLFRSMASQKMLPYALKSSYYRRILLEHGDPPVKEKLGLALMKAHYDSSYARGKALCEIICNVDALKEEAYWELSNISDKALVERLLNSLKRSLSISANEPPPKSQPPARRKVTKMTDEELLAACNSDSWLFEVLVKRYQQPLFHAANKILKNSEDAADTVQEAFLRMYRFSSRFQKREGIAFKSWAYKVCINLAITRYQ